MATLSEIGIDVVKSAEAEALGAADRAEERVPRMPFGVGVTAEHSLAQIGQQLSVNRERIRQIPAKALQKLKHPGRSRELGSFLDI